MPSKELSSILNKLSKVKSISTGGYTAICPAHDDKHNSLGITEEGNKILLKCYTGCTIDQILKSLNLESKDLFTDKKEAKETIWLIKDKEGNTIAEHIRYDKPDGKSFSWRRGGKKGLGGLKTMDLPLYGIDKLNNNEMVVVCEGEKAADSLIKRDIPAVGTVSGANGTPSEEILSSLKDVQNIYLWPDKDEPGYHHMNNIASNLMKLNKSPMVILWDNAPYHGDAADYHDDLHELLSKSIPWDVDVLSIKEDGPQIIQSYQNINYVWDNYGLRILVDRYNEEGQAELSFYSANGCGDKRFHFTRGNLLSTNFMATLLRKLEKRNTDIPWDDILNVITGTTVDIAREGDSVIDVMPDDEDTLDTEYLLYPILYKNHPSVLFGDYGSLKSWVSLLIAYLVQLPYKDNPYGLNPLDCTTSILFLDYEDDITSFKKRWSALRKGLDHPAMSLKYRHMTAPLHEQTNQIKSIVEKDKIGLIIVDSLGPAARGNLNDPEPAIKYHAALREIGVTSLTLAHTSKDQLTKKRTIFGSVFFTNLARSVWECKCIQEVEDNEAIISIKHTKANLSKLHKTLGLKFLFSNNAVNINRADISDTELEDQLSITDRILHLLKEGPLSPQIIADRLECKSDTASRTLRRERDNGRVIKLKDGTWGLSL